jgi:hypothetical protein
MVLQQASVLSPSDPPSEDRVEVMRRLTDKILAAFNHAYAVGETAIADRLREILVFVETARNDRRDTRDAYDPLAQADTWVEFVEARNHYKWICENRRNAPAGAADALAAMKEAYRRWSLS